MKPIFYTRMRLGEFDPPEMNPYLNIKDMSLLNFARHRQIALEAAQMSFVLLKNRNNVLPITKFNNTLPLEKIAVSCQECFTFCKANNTIHEYKLFCLIFFSCAQGARMHGAGCLRFQWAFKTLPPWSGRNM